MKYRLFVSDFDGTLVRPDGTISQKNIEAIAAYRAAGGIFAVCTGRMLASIRPRLKELGLEEGYVVAFQGAQIADIATGKLLRDNALKEEEASELLRFMETQSFRIQIYVGENVIANRRSRLLELYEQICRVQAKVSEGSLSDMVAAKHLRVVKTVILCMPEEQSGIVRLLRERFGEKYYIACSSEYLVEVMPKNQTKGAAIAFLAEQYHIPAEEIAAIGDQENDMPMLEAAGGKFAVENAVPALKAIATVVPSVEEDGVAYVLRRYAMGEEIR